jgi:serine O-acetyltransferase
MRVRLISVYADETSFTECLYVYQVQLSVAIPPSLRQDWARYRATGWPRLSILTAQGFWATCVYRATHALLLRSHAGPERLAARVVCVAAQKFMELTAGISLPAACEIGPGLYIGHPGPITVHEDAHIGRDCNLSQGVLIGIGGVGEREGVPRLGDRVHLAPYAIVLGNVVVGDDVSVAPGTVVARSVPARAVIAGNPARIVSYAGSARLVRGVAVPANAKAAAPAGDRNGGFNHS